MTTTTNPLDALVATRDGYLQARWNFPLADNTPVASPGGIGQAVSLTYSFAATAPGSYYAGPTASRFTPEMMVSTQDVLARISEVANVTFTEVGGPAQITFRQGTHDASGAAYLPYFEWQNNRGTIDYLFEPEVSGDVWMDDAQAWTAADLEPGGFAHLSLLRNVGTALGLKDHSQDWGTMLAPELNDQAHTVMSPIAAPNDRPSTLMLLDMQALQYLYGANYETRAGNDVYDWGTSAPLLETIWDGGGRDTIDCGNQVLRCVIRLEAGAFSLVGRQGEFAIANGVVIEHAIGGSGADSLIGNGAANRLTGNAGSDVLNGAAGRDILSGGAGQDKLAGGAGADVFNFDRAAHTGASAATRDVISDFVRGQDVIDLAGIDADTGTAANDAFRYIGAADFSADATGELRLEGGILYGSTDEDAAAEFSIEVVGVTALGAADLVM
ncbi:M10 family metallopeptidase C-terminal domain-containing protein [Ramlibacter sp. PS3R-8]|uniref:M10 family metallopeptidase C-terminal domain-containing protein n=1 Tax=Ramlibacter sp. PS3R-8 TaxID=3133437 RepID=UPI0030AD55A6